MPMQDDGIIDSTRTSTTVSTSQRQLPPGMKEDLVKRTAENSGLAADLQQKLKEIGISFAVNANDQTAAVDKNVAAKQEQSAANANKDSLINQNANDILSDFGINRNDPTNIIAENVAIINKTNAERTALTQQISTLKQGADPLNPLGWLMSSIQQVPLINKHNALLMERNNAINNIEVAQRLATNQTAIQPAALGQAINEKKMADAKALEAEGLMKRLEIEGAAASKIAQTMIEVGQSSGQDLARHFQLADVLGRNVSTSTSSVSMTKEEKEEKDFFRSINLVWTSVFGGAKPLNKITFATLDKDTQQELVRATAYKPNGDGYRIGTNPGVAVSTIYGVLGNAGIEEMRKSTPVAADFMSGVIAEGDKRLTALKTDAATPGSTKAANAEAELKKAKSPIQELSLGINAYVKEINEDLQRKDFTKLLPNNPYKLNYSYVATSEQLKNNSLAQWVLKKPQGIAANEQLLLSKAVSDLVDKGLPLAQVSGEVYEFYAKGTKIQQADTRMHQFGFKELTNYPVMMNVYSARAMPVDLFNRNSIEQFLTSQVAAKMVSDSTGPTFMQQLTGVP